MGMVVVRHKVRDFALWKQHYDDPANANPRVAAGLINDRVLQMVDDPNNVVVIFEYQDLEKVQEFTSSPDLKAAMESAGIVEEPTIYFTKEATD